MRDEEPGGMGINGVVPGAGVCVVAGCLRRCPEGALMCRTHWSEVPRQPRWALRDMMIRWNGGSANLQELRDAQWACVDMIEEQP